jgi:hypothetical protein
MRELLKRIWEWMHTRKSAEAPYRPPAGLESGFRRYLASYLWLRVAVGLMGIALPVVLLLGDALVLDTAITMRPSLSAYYHSPMRDFYVSVLFATGIVLVTYRIAEKDFVAWLSFAAGVMVVVVALVPTGLPRGCSPADAPAEGCPRLTALQEYFGEALLASTHRWASIVFILAMALLTIIFALQEDNRRRSADARAPWFWGSFHWACAVVMLAALAFNGLSDVLGFWRDHTLTVVESVCAAAFGLSWLVKGAERPFLFPSAGRAAIDDVGVLAGADAREPV